MVTTMRAMSFALDPRTASDDAVKLSFRHPGCACLENLNVGDGTHLGDERRRGIRRGLPASVHEAHTPELEVIRCSVLHTRRT